MAPIALRLCANANDTRDQPSQGRDDRTNDDGDAQWHQRAKAPSPTYPDAYLYAMRYAVSVLSERESLAIYETSCQVVVVQRNETYSEPTVACAPVNLNQPGDAS